MMMDTRVPSSRKKEKARRVMVELKAEGQHPDIRHGAEPHRQDAYRRNGTTVIQSTILFINLPSMFIVIQPTCTMGSVLSLKSRSLTNCTHVT